MLLEPPPRTTCSSLSKPFSTQSRTCGSQTHLRPATEQICATYSAEEDQIGREKLKSFCKPTRRIHIRTGRGPNDTNHVTTTCKIYHVRTTSTNTVFTQPKKTKKLLFPSRTGKRPPPSLNGASANLEGRPVWEYRNGYKSAHCLESIHGTPFAGQSSIATIVVMSSRKAMEVGERKEKNCSQVLPVCLTTTTSSSVVVLSSPQ